MSRTIARRWARAGALTVCLTAAATFGVGAGPTASASPSAADVREQATKAGEKLEDVNEQVVQAQDEVDKDEKAARKAEKSAAKAQATLDELSPQLRAIAQAGYGGGSSSRIAAFLTSSSAEDLIEQMSTLDQLATRTDHVVAAIAEARDKADQAQTDAEQALAAAKTAEDDLTAKKDDLEDKVADYESQLASLETSDRSAVRNAVSGVSLTDIKPAPAPTAAAGVAVTTALAQVGDPYVSAASGPNAFDCSGLTMYAYAAAGISLPHSSLAQSQLGTPVSRSDLQPGDLVFFYSPVSHVGIYIGNGQMVHAPVPGQSVTVTSVDKGGYVSARRVATG